MSCETVETLVVICLGYIVGDVIAKVSNIINIIKKR
jgi:hypothetical protein